MMDKVIDSLSLEEADKIFQEHGIKKHKLSAFEEVLLFLNAIQFGKLNTLYDIMNIAFLITNLNVTIDKEHLMSNYVWTKSDRGVFSEELASIIDDLVSIEYVNIANKNSEIEIIELTQKGIEFNDTHFKEHDIKNFLNNKVKEIYNLGDEFLPLIKDIFEQRQNKELESILNKKKERLKNHFLQNENLTNKYDKTEFNLSDNRSKPRVKPSIIFELQTLIDEWDYIAYFDNLLYETLNGYGAKIDYRNYITLRNNIIFNRGFGTSGFLDIVRLISQLILPKGYDEIIFNKLIDNLLVNKKKLIKLYDEVPRIIPILSDYYSLSIISNNSSVSADLLTKNNLNKYFQIIHLSQNFDISKFNPLIFNKVFEFSDTTKAYWAMVGERLDIDIYPANQLGIKTVRSLNSIYRVQKPINKNEKPLFVISSLNELPELLANIF